MIRRDSWSPQECLRDDGGKWGKGLGANNAMKSALETKRRREDSILLHEQRTLCLRFPRSLVSSDWLEGTGYAEI